MRQSSKRQPVFNVPVVLVSVLVVLLAVQAARAWLTPEADADLLARFAFVPGRFDFAWHGRAVLDGLATLEANPTDGEGAEVARFFLGDGSPQPWTALTYGLLHGNWTHLGLNAIWLLAFGAPVARRLGNWGFVLFLTGGALAGALAHALVFPAGLQPLIGASAAVSGCMAGALRFMFQPPVAAPAPEADGPTVPPPPRDFAVLPLTALIRDRRTLTFLIVWFLTNIVSGLGAVSFGWSDAPVAWQAHIGGFLFGLFGFPFMDRLFRVARA